MKVYGLVGDSGTGKSHRASIIARELDVRYIVDDGLLICDSKILAGRSAKKASTRIGAVRCAIFEEEDHANVVRTALARFDPEAVLILATSQRMVRRICQRLELPEPAAWLDIREVATEREIAQAREIRRREGKHVIPAPTFEVKKNFSGYLVDPLRLFHRGVGRRRRRGTIIEKSIVRPTFSSLGRFFITDRVVAAIAAQAALEDGAILQVQRVRVEVRDDGVLVELQLVLRYGANIYSVLERAQQRARERVEHMTALNVLALDVVARRLDVEAVVPHGTEGEDHGRQDSGR